jgi:hypothetical protein
MSGFNYNKWAFIWGIPATLAAITTVFGFVASKDFRCSIVGLLGISSDSCIQKPDLAKVNFIVQTKERNPIEGASVTFIFAAPEVRITDSQGYVQNKIPLRENVDVIISKKGYKTLTQTINLDIRRDDKPVVYQLENLEETSTQPSLPSQPFNPSTPSAVETPVESPILSNSQPVEIQEFSLELQGCELLKQIVTCKIVIRSTKKSTGTLGCSSRIFFNGGYEKYPQKIQLVDQKGDCNGQYGIATKDFISDVPYKAILTFSNIAPNINKIEELEVSFRNSKASWRNINLSSSN